MQGERGMGAGGQTGGTRYVFAGTPDRPASTGTKVCPRCGEVLFEDMSVCYGCLYDFDKDVRTARPKSMPAQGRGAADTIAERLRAALPEPSYDLLDTIELDEIDDDAAVDELADEPSVPARHRKRKDLSSDDTTDLSLARQAEASSGKVGPFVIVAKSQDMQVRLPLPKEGLTVGRGEGNDIVLSSKSVSRRHLVLLPKDGAVLVEDRGATNPAVVDGLPLEGSAEVGLGGLVVVCGTTLQVEGAPPDPAA